MLSSTATAVASKLVRNSSAIRSVMVRASTTRAVHLLANGPTIFPRTHTITNSNVFFSSGSHDDFAPKRKAVEGESEALDMIKVRLCHG